MRSKLLVLILLLLTGKSFAQADWEYRMVRDINPQYPGSDVWKAFSTTAKPLAVALPAGLFVVGLIEKNRSIQYNALEALGSLAIAAGTTELLKQTVKRPRPYQVHADIYPDEVSSSYSFPSGHVSTAFSTATSLSLTSKKWYVTVPAFAWATGVAYSRMYEGQHYPSDVFAGAALGAGSALLTHWLRKKLFH